MFQGFNLYFQASGFHFQKLRNTFRLSASGIQPAFSFCCQNPDFLKKIKDPIDINYHYKEKISPIELLNFIENYL